ncbi:MAG: cation acetate symporter, partial [Acidimicrobiia bacterium]
NSTGMISGLTAGLGFSVFYMYMTLYGDMDRWWDISPEGIGAVGMVINFIVTIVVSKKTAPPPQHIQDLIEEVRHPRLTSGV